MKTGSKAMKAKWDGHAPRALLEAVASGEVTVAEALAKLRAQPYEDLGFARLDHHRAVRKGFPEVVYGAGKTPGQMATILQRLAHRSNRVLATRASLEHYKAAKRQVRDLQYDEVARCLFLDRDKVLVQKRSGNEMTKAGVVLTAAGTSDLPVAREAELTVKLMGYPVHTIFDIGVAGLHRLLPHVTTLQEANVVIVVAGMEGALPSVVGGLTRAPVIAVPTSVGYGASFGGVAALLGMLNSCAPGLAVVNIDNGFGAGFMAASILRKVEEAAR